MKTDEIIVKQIKERAKARKIKLMKLRIERDRIQEELFQLLSTDTAEQLAKEFGIGKSTVDRIVSKL